MKEGPSSQDREMSHSAQLSVLRPTAAAFPVLRPGCWADADRVLLGAGGAGPGGTAVLRASIPAQGTSFGLPMGLG